ncbi:Ldh family oxidoreductase, partial [Chloroflexota bacterium]
VTKNTNVDADKLTNFATKVLQKVGIPEKDARTTAGLLVATDLRGVDSHGVGHLGPFYVKRIREELINPKPKIKVFSQAPATAVIDGDRGLGFVVGHQAMNEAIQRAETTGAGFVTVRNSTHFGAGAIYAIMALSRDMIGISMTTGTIGMKVPGGSGRGAGINVICIAAPAEEEAPFVLDMATTVVPNGKIELALRKGMTLPKGWAVNKEGEPITDPSKYYEEIGALLPLGGTPQTGSYKGFGLSLVVDILCSILSGSVPIPQLLSEPKSQGRGNHFFGALRIDGFMPVDEFRRAIDGMAKLYRGLPRAAGVDRISLPGEIEQEIEKERRSKGIPLHPTVVTSLQELAKELDIEYDLW